MSADTPTLTEFLLARIAEDESGAHAARTRINWLRMCDSIAEQTRAEVGLFVLDHDPERVLAECEAKRRIVTEDGWGYGHIATALHRLLALPYANHPDYREEWKP